MDKYEYKLKLDELTELFQLKKYKEAADLADEINWQKVRNAKTLCMVADIYEAVERYDTCQEVLMQAYDHTSVGKNIVSRLTDIAIKSKDVRSAEEYYNEFLELAPRDTERFVFAYKIACLKNAPLADRIAILEEFKEQEYSEMWAYELAVLYAQAGMREKCVETCDELILWFGDGEYVERALDLKRSFQPLTPSQEEKYQKLRSERGMVEINIPQKTETAAGAVKEEIPAPDLVVTATKFNTQNLQDEIARSMQQIMDATEENTVRDQLNSIKKIVQDIPYLEGEEEVSLSQREKIQEEVDEELKSDFQEKLVGETAYGPSTVNAQSGFYAEETSGMSIEEILADWERTKAVAEEAMAAAEQKKLDLEKEQALAEANDIMRRLQELMPILSATPDEDLMDPGTAEGPVAEELRTAEPIDLTPQQPSPIPGEPKETQPFYFDTSPTDTLPEDQATTRPLQEAIEWARRAEHGTSGQAESEESPRDWPEEGEQMSFEDLQTGMTAAEEPEIPEAEAPEEEIPGEESAPAMTEIEIPEGEEIPEEEIPEEEIPEGEIPEAGEFEEEIPEEEIPEEEIPEEEIPEAGEFEEEIPEEEIPEEEIPEEEIPEAGEEIPEEEPTEEDFFDEEEPEEADEEGAPQEVYAQDGFEQDDFAEEGFAEDGFAQEDYGQEDYSQEDFAPVEDDTQWSSQGSAAPLSEEMQGIFSYFIPIPGMAEQISTVLGNTVKYKSTAVTSSQGNVIVQGEEGSGKTMLATDLIKAARQTMGREDDRIGKISADALNTRNFSSLIPKIGGGYLIVEDAGNLSAGTIASMSAAMDQDTGGMTVILEDDSAGIRHVMGLDPDFEAKFTERIKIPIFTIDELVDFGKSYALEQECEIEEMAVLALYNRINNIQKVDHPTTLTEVKEIVDEAIANAESGGIKKLFAKKYNEEDFLILHEEDFGF